MLKFVGRNLYLTGFTVVHLTNVLVTVGLEELLLPTHGYTSSFSFNEVLFVN
jgi:hypothetical protein